MNMRDDVLGFIEKIGQVDADAKHDVLGNEHDIQIYRNLIDEEYTEFTDAPNDVNRINEAMDLIWVVLGYCLVRGWDVRGAWDELTRANMSKLQTDPLTGKLKRRADGKIMKPDNWKPGDFAPYVNGDNSSLTKEVLS